MAKLETKLKCDNCPDGIVTLVTKKTTKGGGISSKASVKSCNKCKKYFGLKSIQHLEQIKS